MVIVLHHISRGPFSLKPRAGAAILCWYYFALQGTKEVLREHVSYICTAQLSGQSDVDVEFDGQMPDINIIIHKPNLNLRVLIADSAAFPRSLLSYLSHFPCITVCNNDNNNPGDEGCMWF
jgi:hypothetical protein